MFDVTAFERPRWIRDVRRFLPLKPQFVLSGNVRDLQPLDVGTGQVTSQPLSVVLAAELRDVGYAHVLLYDPVAGFGNFRRREARRSPGARSSSSSGSSPTKAASRRRGST